RRGGPHDAVCGLPRRRTRRVRHPRLAFVARHDSGDLAPCRPRSACRATRVGRSLTSTREDIPMPTAETARRETAAALRTVREQWGELLLAIESPPTEPSPPRHLAHTMRPVDDEPFIERAPLVLREHPAPANLDALDAGLSVERQVFELADTL